MTKQAHITSKPNYEVGEKVLALCGKDFKVKVLWTDVPTEKPICRECVDVALDAMTEADTLITRARGFVELLMLRVDGLDRALNPPDLFLDVLAENESEYAEARAEKARAKAEKKRAKTTCTCTWGEVTGDPTETTGFIPTETDPDCPIHGERPPVAPPEEDDASGK